MCSLLILVHLDISEKLPSLFYWNNTIFEASSNNLQNGMSNMSQTVDWCGIRTWEVH